MDRVEAARYVRCCLDHQHRFAGTAQAFQAAQQGLLVLLVLAILVIYLCSAFYMRASFTPSPFSRASVSGFGRLLALLIFGSTSALRLRRLIC